MPSLEQKQYGKTQVDGSHFVAKSVAGSVTGATAVVCLNNNKKKINNH